MRHLAAPRAGEAVSFSRLMLIESFSRVLPAVGSMALSDDARDDLLVGCECIFACYWLADPPAARSLPSCSFPYVKTKRNAFLRRPWQPQGFRRYVESLGTRRIEEHEAERRPGARYIL